MQRAPSYGSDLVVDLVRAVGIEYVVLNPGATYRARHDSLVNYGGNRARATTAFERRSGNTVSNQSPTTSSEDSAHTTSMTARLLEIDDYPQHSAPLVGRPSGSWPTGRRSGSGRARP